MTLQQSQSRAGFIPPPPALSRKMQSPMRAAAAIEPSAFRELRRRLILEHCKWDPQVGDVATLAQFPLLLQRQEWKQLAGWAEQLTEEALGAEQEILRSPGLLKELGLPRRLRRAFPASVEPSRSVARIFRFDFHLTTNGWRISESNSDVPGGYAEASSFAAMMQAHFPQTRSAGDVGECWADAIASTVSADECIALISAVGYMEDQQIVAYLARRLIERGVRAIPARIQDLQWDNGIASLRGNRLGAIVRFFQGEWLAGLPRSSGWRNLIHGQTPIINPVRAVITESKRFPLLWPKLATNLPTWRQLLPQTCDARDVPWQRGEDWLIKQAFCNTGDSIFAPDLLAGQRWEQIVKWVRREPRRWVAQRRFTPVPIETPLGPAFPCIGVYTVNGRAAGIYGRLSTRQIIDFAAIDVAVLIDNAVATTIPRHTEPGVKPSC
ncbi:MAG TPA: glutathionylspermidine synthase family protein [Humisphaera sp.]|jgi:glutathionylspermidine synthase|nr:glutathionylspermidine synthase family protein [Humisphaera sp.]